MGHRRHLILGTLAAALLTGTIPTPGSAADYPTRPIRMIIPAAAGGGNDALGRVLADGLGKLLGQPVVLDFKGGASGRLAGELVATAPPDGYTLLMTYAGLLTVNPAMFREMKYDSVRDFAPISAFVQVPNVLVVHPAIPAANVADLIALARSKPGRMSFASSGNGTSIFLAMESMRQKTGMELIHVTYKGGAPAMADVMGGQVDMMFNNLVEVAPMAKAGRLRALAIGSLKRSALLPDVPPVAESGLPGYESTLWYGLVAPANTPPAIVERLHRATREVQQDPVYRARLASMGADTMDLTVDAFGRLIKDEIALWTEVIRKAGIKPD